MDALAEFFRQLLHLLVKKRKSVVSLEHGARFPHKFGREALARVVDGHGKEGSTHERSERAKLRHITKDPDILSEEPKLLVDVVHVLSDENHAYTCLSRLREKGEHTTMFILRARPIARVVKDLRLINDDEDVQLADAPFYEVLPTVNFLREAKESIRIEDLAIPARNQVSHALLDNVNIGVDRAAVREVSRNGRNGRVGFAASNPSLIDLNHIC